MPLTWPDAWPSSGPVRLRPFRDTDLPLVAELSTDPYLPLIGSIPAVYSDEAGLAYIARQHQRVADGTGYSFAIADRADDRGLGGAGLWLKPEEPERATLGYAVAPSARGRGVASAALAALTAFGWTMPALHRLELLIEPENVASRRAAERSGYVQEALLPRHLEIGGTWRDMLLYRSHRSSATKG